ncbi:cystathionine gamma-synthase [Actinomyces provencensis]|uniref:cystathionine gamma-synthase n=1 Tax=Actinomyces provencensis TaxID=1720198 RepID=UPI00227F1AF4|nr:cystathionine gamma-synthase [Actinomyces provencensis]
MSTRTPSVDTLPAVRVPSSRTTTASPSGGAETTPLAMTYADSVTDLIGDTPLVRLTRVTEGIGATVLAKLEYLNPGGSSKDRIAQRIIEAAEATGHLRPGGTIVEPTSGNTGVGLALFAIQRGYHMVFVAPDKVSREKRDVLRALGAEVVVTPTNVTPEDPDSYYSVADRLVEAIPGAFRPDQYSNPNGPASHHATTGPEIWRDTAGRVTHFVAGVGTGGTISGTGRFLKEASDGRVRVIGADPEGSIYSGGPVHGYFVEGVGEDFWPGAFDPSVPDALERVSDAESFGMTRRLAREEGILVGGSSGMATVAALRVARDLPDDAVVVVLMPDSGRGYMDKVFNDEWMVGHGFAEPPSSPQWVTPRASEVIERYRIVGEGVPASEPLDTDEGAAHEGGTTDPARTEGPASALISAHTSAAGSGRTPTADPVGTSSAADGPTPTGDAFATRAIHAGQEPDAATGAVVTPLYLTSTFAQDGVGGLRGGYEYSRSGNPTRDALQEALASLEGGTHAFSFASGLAAEDTLLRTITRPGDHVLLGNDAYGGTHRLINSVLGAWGVTNSAVDTTDPVALEAAVLRDQPKVVWVETPSNPLLGITDIRAAAEVAHRHGALLVVDNTFATPWLQNPLALGADFVVHSTTKYVGGHSDVLGGAVIVGDDRFTEQLGWLQNAAGAVSSPFDAWLTLRGLKTLAVRVERHSANAAALAEALAGDERIAQVLYPGLSTHPGHAVAERQMRAFGGMVSVRLRGGAEGGARAARAFAASTRLFTLAESLGGVESLIEVPAAMTHSSVKGTSLEVPDDLVRLSVGIEDVGDLVRDVRRALDALSDPVGAARG